jgi:Flp pilus assembly protein TadG
MKARRVINTKQQGAALVEFAIVLPVLLLLVFGMIELGIALYDKAVITNASREGARAGVVYSNPKPNQTAIETAAKSYCNSFLITFAKGGSTGVTMNESGINGAFGTPLSVTVKYVYTGLLLGPMLSALTGPITLSATTTMNNE